MTFGKMYKAWRQTANLEILATEGNFSRAEVEEIVSISDELVDALEKLPADTRNKTLEVAAEIAEDVKSGTVDNNRIASLVSDEIREALLFIRHQLKCKSETSSYIFLGLGGISATLGQVEFAASFSLLTIIFWLVNFCTQSKS